MDLSHAEGRRIVRGLAAQADVFIENFKVGGLAKYGLADADLRPAHPRLVASISCRASRGRDRYANHNEDE